MAYWSKEVDDKIIALLKKGGVGLLPSDTIYGLSCRALDKQAVSKLYRLKKRDPNKPLIVLISDIKMLDLLALPKNLSGAVGNRIVKRQVFGSGLGLKEKDKKLIMKYWPGPLTVIFDAPLAPAWLHRGSETLALRLPDNKPLVGLLKSTGPLVSTSANPEDMPPARTARETQNYFGDELDFYVDKGELKKPLSTIVSFHNGKLKLVRKGAVVVDNL